MQPGHLKNSPPPRQLGYSSFVKAVRPEKSSMSWKKSEALMETIKHYSSFPATGVSLRQMVQFGERPSTGMIGSGVFLAELESDQFCRNPLPCFPIPLRRTTHPLGASCARARGFTGWTE